MVHCGATHYNNRLLADSRSVSSYWNITVSKNNKVYSIIVVYRQSNWKRPEAVSLGEPAGLSELGCRAANRQATGVWQSIPISLSSGTESSSTHHKSPCAILLPASPFSSTRPKVPLPFVPPAFLPHLLS